jgi:hypothetical protein
MRLVLGTAALAAITFCGGLLLGPGVASAQAVEPPSPSAPPSTSPSTSGEQAAPVPRPILPPRGASPRMDSAPAVRGADCSSRHSPDIGV